MSSPIITPGPFLETVAYYQKRVTSEFQGPAPNMLAWLAANLQLGLDVGECLNSMLSAFQLSTAVGDQLDTIGVILGLPRTLPFQPTGILYLVPDDGGTGYLVGDIITVVQSGASGGKGQVVSISGGGVVTGIQIYQQYNGNGYSVATGLSTTGGTGSSLTVNITACLSPVLADSTYRTALRAQVVRNHWNGQTDSLVTSWQVIFPGGRLTIQDNQNMTAAVYLSGAFSSVLIDMIENGLILPRPQGVLYDYTLATLPMFALDTTTLPFTAGLDAGHLV